MRCLPPSPGAVNANPVNRGVQESATLGVRADFDRLVGVAYGEFSNTRRQVEEPKGSDLDN
jgi:hypothetical protein